ncbi:MAG: transposase [Reichenbachiella sp.]|uniref:transposase n=1 Tax=Reichenbachiella sp. TaxID=2184521 RepID=UPI002966CC14|nr:transposase [Reichenbachiella sp.]MDW3210727.1 transposase [Reichenbachiella sp.]
MQTTNLRKSNLEVGKIYFWTATINKWQTLLEKSAHKQIITDSLLHLSKKDLIDIFGFVVMPNHIHLIWRLNNLNGKELPSASLLKFTAHEFKKMLPKEELYSYQIDAPNKKHKFWQENSRAIELWTPAVAYQKLDYIHRNPVSGKWKLVNDWVDYKYSSGSFYENQSSDFGFLKHLGNEF